MSSINISDNVISYIYDRVVKDKVSTLRLHHRHFKSRYSLVKRDFDDYGVRFCSLGIVASPQHSRSSLRVIKSTGALTALQKPLKGPARDVLPATFFCRQ